MKKRICVFLGSTPGIHIDYAQAATELGRMLAQGGFDIVYGGTSMGLMGHLAQAALHEGGKVIGILPKFIKETDPIPLSLTELQWVDSMGDRKAQMAEISDGFIALPGGLGTLDEWTEVISLIQHQIHSKPCGLLNVKNYYEHLIQFLNHAVHQGFLQKKIRDQLLIANSVDEIVESMTKRLQI